MVRVIISGEWYEPIAPSSMYEDNFERIVLSQAGHLFPEYQAISFKSLVTSDSDAARPDFALVERNYREWWVVEVEMGYHSFYGHVLPQVRTLAEAAYGEQEAAALCNSAASLDRSAMRDMMKGSQPRVLVIVNEHKSDWANGLEPFGARVITVEVFRSDRNHHLLCIDGEPPAGTGNIVSRCHLEPSLPRLLAIDSPGGLGIEPRARAILWYEGQVTEWERIDTRNRVWLNPIAKCPLQPSVTYHLTRRGDGQLEIQPE